MADNYPHDEKLVLEYLNVGARGIAVPKTKEQAELLGELEEMCLVAHTPRGFILEPTSELYSRIMPELVRKIQQARNLAADTPATRV